jgi:hypothetical protein
VFTSLNLLSQNQPPHVPNLVEELLFSVEYFGQRSGLLVEDQFGLFGFLGELGAEIANEGSVEAFYSIEVVRARTGEECG